MPSAHNSAKSLESGGFHPQNRVSRLHTGFQSSSNMVRTWTVRADCQPNVGLALRTVTDYENYEAKPPDGGRFKNENENDFRVDIRLGCKPRCSARGRARSGNENRGRGRGRGDKNAEIISVQEILEAGFQAMLVAKSGAKVAAVPATRIAERPQRCEIFGKRRFTAAFTRSRWVVRGDSFAGTALVGGALPRRRCGTGNENLFLPNEPRNEIAV